MYPSSFDPEIVAFLGASQTVATGKDTYKTSQLFYAVKDTTEAKYIFVMEGEGMWIDRNHREQFTWWVMYLKSQDADSDGFPDPGQEPLYASNARWYTWTREPMMSMPRPA